MSSLDSALRALAPAGSASSLPLTVFDLLFHQIASNVPLDSAISLSRSHKSLITRLPTHLLLSCIDLLTPRISLTNIPAFRALLRDTRAVISGSTALSFVIRDTHWQPGDFDIYAPFGTGWALVEWLVRNEGYHIVSDGAQSFVRRPPPIQIPAAHFDWLTELDVDDILSIQLQKRQRFLSKYGSAEAYIYRVYKLSRSSSKSSLLNSFPDSSIDVIESSRASFLPPITKFHSTLVMNYISADSVVVLYPSLTFRRKGVLQYREGSSIEDYEQSTIQHFTSTTPTPGATAKRKKGDYVEKYTARGFALYSRTAELQRPCGAACPALIREMGGELDELVLEVNFGAADIRKIGGESGQSTIDGILKSADDLKSYEMDSGVNPSKSSCGINPSVLELDSIPMSLPDPTLSSAVLDSNATDTPVSELAPPSPARIAHDIGTKRSSAVTLTASSPSSTPSGSSSLTLHSRDISFPDTSTYAADATSGLNTRVPDSLSAYPHGRSRSAAVILAMKHIAMPTRPPIPATSWSLQTPPLAIPAIRIASTSTSKERARHTRGSACTNALCPLFCLRAVKLRSRSLTRQDIYYAV